MKAVSPLLCLLLAACATPLPPPAVTGPTVSVMPGKKTTFEQFLLDDQRCRRHAASLDTGNSADEVAANSVLAGVATGAAAGALLGGNSHAAAQGAGIGLLAGVLGGQQSAQATQAQRQYRYNLAYQQCMVAKGHTAETASSAAWRSGQPPAWHTEREPAWVLVPAWPGGSGHPPH